MRIIRGLKVLSAVTVVGALMQPAMGADAAATRAAEPAKVDMPAELAARIDKAIELLEGNKHKEFIEAFIAPQVLQKFKEKGRVEQMEKSLAGNQGKQILQVLKDARKQKVTLLEDGNRAGLFNAEGRQSMTFDKIDGVWYMGS